jgi:ABC-2 type transport system ATP-binding protein
MIELIRLTKTYRGLKAVDGIDLSVRKGSVFGFLGPNGAGKTTTIRMMAGVLQPTSGQVVIAGKDLAKEPTAVKKSLGYVPDRPFLYEKLSGEELLRFVAELYRVDGGAHRERRIDELLLLFDLAHWRHELIESFSHGMKQRLVMCAALLHDPEVLIVDEPMVGLDPRGARLVKDLFRGRAAAGKTVFMSTHSLEVAQELCDEVAIVQAGRLIVKGTPGSLGREMGVEGPLEDVFLTLTEGTPVAHERPLSSH